MRKTISALIFALILTLLLSGCQSPRKNEPVPDRFVGVNVVAFPSDAQDEPARSEPHELGGYYLMIPFDYAMDGEKYSQALQSGHFQDTSFHLSVSDDGDKYSMAASLYIGELANEGSAIFIERVYQRADGTLYAVNTGYSLDDPLPEISFYDWSETRRVADDEGTMRNETTSISLTIIGAPPSTSAPSES